ALFKPWSAAAQDNAALTVTVSDTTGARVTDAAVVLSRTGQERAVTTGPDGTTTIRGLTAGTWTVEISRDGFVPARRQVVVQAAPVSINVSLEISGVRQSVV